MSSYSHQKCLSVCALWGPTANSVCTPPVIEGSERCGDPEVVVENKVDSKADRPDSRTAEAD